MSSEMLAAACVLFLLSLLSLAGALSLRTAIRDEKLSRPVIWLDEE